MTLGSQLICTLNAAGSLSVSVLKLTARSNSLSVQGPSKSASSVSSVPFHAFLNGFHLSVPDLPPKTYVPLHPTSGLQSASGIELTVAVTKNSDAMPLVKSGQPYDAVHIFCHCPNTSTNFLST